MHRTALRACTDGRGRKANGTRACPTGCVACVNSAAGRSRGDPGQEHHYVVCSQRLCCGLDSTAGMCKGPTRSLYGHIVTEKSETVKDVIPQTHLRALLYYKYLHAYLCWPAGHSQALSFSVNQCPLQCATQTESCPTKLDTAGLCQCYSNDKC